MKSRMHGLTRTLSVFAVAGALAAASLTGASPAHAAIGDLECGASAVITFTPPLTGANTSADVTVTGLLSNCLSPNGAHTDLTSGTVTATGSATAQGGVPCSLLLTITASGSITWNTGEKSQLRATLNTNPLAGTIDVSADITDGPLKGDTAAAAIAANPNPDCATAGLKQLTIPAAEVTFN